MSLETCFNMLMSDPLSSFICPWTAIMGNWFFVVMVFTFEILLYLRTGSWPLVAIMGIFTSIPLLTQLQSTPALQAGVTLLILTIAVSLYGLVKGGER